MVSSKNKEFNHSLSIRQMGWEDATCVDVTGQELERQTACGEEKREAELQEGPHFRLACDFCAFSSFAVLEP
jgi:hypothetical protein